MSSDQDELCSGETWTNSLHQDESLPPPPTTAGGSRVLDKLLNNVKQVEDVNHHTTAQSSSASPLTNNCHSDIETNQPNGDLSQTTKLSQQPLTLPEIHSNLSVDAKEFVPRTQDKRPDEPSGLSVEAAEFVPRRAYTSVPTPLYPKYQEGCGDNKEGLVTSNEIPGLNGLSLQDSADPEYDGQVGHSGQSILYKFNIALAELNLSPGHMEEYLRPICDMIKKSSETSIIVQDLVENLFEQSLLEPNFRYTGARICQFLNTRLKGIPQFSEFHRIMICRCQQEYEARDRLRSGGPEEQERLRGLAMFLAEMFLNVEEEKPDGSLQRIQFLPGLIVDLVGTLLSSSTDADVKCSCQLLKLSGALIEDVVKHVAEDCIKFEDIFTQLASLQSSDDVSDNVQFLVSSVLKLKEAGWNRAASSPPKKSQFSFTWDAANYKAPEPVFYNKLGVPCSRIEAGLPEEEDDEEAYILNEEEEEAYLEWQTECDSPCDDPSSWGNNDTGYDSYQLEEIADDDGMGDEMEAAYEEFLQKQPFVVNRYQQPQPATTVLEPLAQPVLHHVYNQPSPNLPAHSEFNGYTPTHMLPAAAPLPLHLMQSNVQPAALHVILPNSQQQPHILPMSPQPPQPHLVPADSQQQNHYPQYPPRDQVHPYQSNYPKNDRYHFNR